MQVSQKSWEHGKNSVKNIHSRYPLINVWMQCNSEQLKNLWGRGSHEGTRDVRLEIVAVRCTCRPIVAGKEILMSTPTTWLQTFKLVLLASPSPLIEPARHAQHGPTQAYWDRLKSRSEKNQIVLKRWHLAQFCVKMFNGESPYDMNNKSFALQ